MPHPKKQREFVQCAQSTGQCLLVIACVLSVGLKWLSKLYGHRVPQEYFSSAANDISRDSTERAKYKGLHDVLTSVPYVFNPGVMYNAPALLSDLSRMPQRRGTMLPEADKLLAQQFWVFESLFSTPGPYIKTALEAQTEKSFKNVALNDNQRIMKINAGRFFHSIAKNMKRRVALTTSSHVSTQ